MDRGSKCAKFGRGDTARANGTCILWPLGAPVQITPNNSYTSSELGYTENPNGTKCKRCSNFLAPNDCRMVDRSSPGDDPRVIHPEACCAAQSPKTTGGYSNYLRLNG